MTVRALAVLVAFAVSVALRVVVGGAGVAQSARAGLVFAACLVLVSVAARTKVALSWKAVVVGLAGVLLVCAPVAVGQLMALRPLHASAGFAKWAIVVAVVAIAEEVVLRGTLYDAIDDLAGATPAVIVGAICFAALHVPLYGWHVVPLDLVVGLVLGGLREATGTPLAPAVTHVGADLVAWFLR